MNLLNKFTKKEIKLLDNIGINIQDRDYGIKEIKEYESDIERFIISHSSKNGDISKYANEYRDILDIMIKCQ